MMVRMSAVCPKCLADLRPVEYQGVTVDVCPGCRGVWLDPGELALLRGADQDVPAASVLGRTGHPESSGYICPRCEGGFETFEFAPDTSLYVDRCKNCQGIWLDAGELTKVRAVTERRRFLGLEVAENSQEKLREFMKAQRAIHSAPPGASSAEATSGGRSGAGVYFFQLLTGMPVEVDARRSRFPAVTLALVLFNAGAFLVQLANGAGDATFYERYAFIPALLKHGEGVLGLFTGMFLHGGLWHLLGNMYFLWLFGDNVEDRLSRPLFLIFYLVCGLAASLLHGGLTEDAQMPTLGASGAISGVMGAYLVLYPKRRLYQVFWFIQFKVSVAFYLLFWLGLQLLFSTAGESGVAWYAHVGGFVVGAAGIWLLGRLGLVKPELEGQKSRGAPA